MQVGVYLQTFRGTLLPLSSGSKKPNNNSSWKLDVFCNTRIFTSTAVKTSNVAGINVTFASSKADERWLQKNVCELCVDRMYSVAVFWLFRPEALRKFFSWKGPSSLSSLFVTCTHEFCPKVATQNSQEGFPPHFSSLLDVSYTLYVLLSSTYEE